MHQKEGENNMTVEEMIKEIYVKTIDIVLNNTDGQYKDELIKSYQNYLERGYLNLDTLEQSYEEILPIFLDYEISYWQSMSPEAKLSRLLSDIAYEKILEISNLGYDCAMRKINHNNIENFFPIDRETANKSIEFLTSLITQVKEFNKVPAEDSVSEGILDFQFAAGLSKVKSLRIGRIS